MKFLSLGSLKPAHGEKASSSSTDKLRLAARLLARLLQFTLGITVIGLYATDLHAASRAGKYMDAKWVFAVTVGSISALAALALALVHARLFFFVADALVCFLYLVLFGIFGRMYISEDPEGNRGIVRMKNAVWIDLVNLLLWLASAVYGAVAFARNRKAGRPASVV